MKNQTIARNFPKVLRQDKELYNTYQANIAMAIKDNIRWHQAKTGKRYLSRQDIHTIANETANYFLNMLTEKFYD